MPDEIYANQPSDNPAPEPYVSTEANFVNHHPPENQHLERLAHEVQRLRRQLGWVSALSVAALILAGVLAGLMLSVKLEQDQQKQQVRTLTSHKAEDEHQINSLNQQIVSLNQQMISLNSEVILLNQQVPLNVSQAQLKPLVTIVDELNSKAITREQLNEALQRIQPKLNNGRQSSTPSPAFSPSP